MASPPDDDTASLLRRVRDYWEGKRGTRDFPSRSDIDPIDFSFALGRVSLIDVHYEPLRFRFRLVATTLSEYLGYEMTGKMLDAIPETGMFEYLFARYSEVIERRAPVLDAGNVLIGGRLWKHETLYLPLSSDGVTIDLLMSCRVTEPPRKHRKSGVPLSRPPR